MATSIKFSNHSAITILTGANGSGKTMLVEALQLVLGFTPKTPRKRKGQATYVAEHADHALIDLIINNPLIDGQRLLKSSKPRLQPLINRNEVTIRLKINKDGSSQHYLVTEKRKGLGRPISKDELRDILKHIDINTKNVLVFTEEGTISEFSKKTPLMRFRTFLEVTGLAHYQDEITQLRNDIASFRQKIKPLKERIALEQQKVQLLEQRAKEYKEKIKLETQLHDLQHLHQWAEVKQLENQEKEIQNRLTTLKNTLLTLDDERNTVKNIIQELKEKKMKLELELEEVEKTLSTIETEFGQLTEQKKQHEHVINISEKNVQEITIKINQFKEVLKKKIDPQINERLEELRRRIHEKENEINVISPQIKEIQERINELENTLKKLGKKIHKRTRDARSPQRPTEHESRLVRAARVMREKAKKNPRLNEELVGPVFNLIRVKEGHEKWESAVKRLCGRHLYSFIAMSREAYEQAKNIYDQIEPRIRSYIEVARYEPQETNKIQRDPLPSLPPEIHDWAINVLEGDPACLWWLSKNLNSLLAENTINPNQATDIAIRYKVYIITQDGESYYLPKGAFSGPPPPMVVPLGGKLDELQHLEENLDHQTFSDIKEALSEHRERIYDLRERKLNLIEEVGKLKEELQQLSKGNEELQRELSQLEASHHQHVLEMKESRKQLEEISKKINVLKKQKKTAIKKKKELQQELKDIEKRIFSQENKLQEIIEEKAKIQENITTLEEELFNVQNQLDEKLRNILSTEDSDRLSNLSNDIPGLEELEREIAILSAKINQIQATEKDEEEYLKHLGKFEELKKYLSERERHLSGLLEDFDKRLNSWKEKLLIIIQEIGKNMNELLGHKYEVALRVKNVHRIDQTELDILIKEALSSTKSLDTFDETKKRNEWRDLSQLSGGEKQLVAEAFFLALHLTVNTPLHTIDEFSQRLDRDNIGLALAMVERASEISTRQAPYQTQFLLIAPELEGYKINPNIRIYTFAQALTTQDEETMRT